MQVDCIFKFRSHLEDNAFWLRKEWFFAYFLIGFYI